MKQFIVTYDNALLLFTQEHDEYRIESKFKGANPIAVTQDPVDTNIIYCGTFDRGLWKSDDSGETWIPIGTRFKNNDAFKQEDIHMTRVTSVKAYKDEGGTLSMLLVGTEPSTLFVSYDQGESFELVTDFSHIEGKDKWFFPPRPYTHHVKWQASNPHQPENIFVTIEAGGMLYSEDYGRSWQANKANNAPVDIHVLRTHPTIPNTLYGVCGDAFLNNGHGTVIESTDYGATWQDINEGIEAKYGYSLAVNEDNDLVISTAKSPYKAHSYTNDTASTIYYRQRDNDAQWVEATEGLPDQQGTIISALTEYDGVFYAANNKGVFYSENGGQQWQQLNVNWPHEFTNQHAHQIIPIV